MLRAARGPLIVLVAIAFVVRLAIVVADPQPGEVAGLAHGHGEEAHNIVHHGRWFVTNDNAPPVSSERLVDRSEVDSRVADANPDFEPYVLQMPGDVLILAAFWKLTGDEDYIYLQLLHVFVDSLVVLAVFAASMLLFGRRRAALVAAGIYAVFLPIAWLVKMPHTDAGATYATIAAAWATVAAIRSERPARWLLLAGLLTGIGTYFRPSVLLVPVLMGLSAGFWVPWRRAAAVAVVPLAVTATMLVPWVVRNYAEFDRFIPTRTGTGLNLWEGLGELPNRFGAVVNDEAVGRMVARERPGLRYGRPEFDDYLQAKALRAMKEDPAFVARLVVRRLLHGTVRLRNASWIGDAELPGEYSARTGEGLVSYVVHEPFDALRAAVAGAGETLLFGLAVVVAVVTRRRWWRQHLVLLAVPLATLLPYLVLHFEPRYLLPASFAYMVIVGFGADLLLERRRGAAQA